MLQMYTEVVQALVHVLDAAGIAVILGGFVFATGGWLAHLRDTSAHQAFQDFRRRSVRGLILGLEFLVAADVIKTVTVNYSLESVLILGLIILIRSFLVFALHLEIEGRLPWTRDPGDADAL